LSPSTIEHRLIDSQRLNFGAFSPQHTNTESFATEGTPKQPEFPLEITKINSHEIQERLLNTADP